MTACHLRPRYQLSWLPIWSIYTTCTTLHLQGIKRHWNNIQIGQSALRAQTTVILNGVLSFQHRAQNFMQTSECQLHPPPAAAAAATPLTPRTQLTWLISFFSRFSGNYWTAAPCAMQYEFLDSSVTNRTQKPEIEIETCNSCCHIFILQNTHTHRERHTYSYFAIFLFSKPTAYIYLTRFDAQAKWKVFAKSICIKLDSHMFKLHKAK